MEKQFRTIYTAFCLEHYPDKPIKEFERDIAVLGKQLQPTLHITGNTLVDAQLIGQASTQHNRKSEEKAVQNVQPDGYTKADGEAEAEPSTALAAPKNAPLGDRRFKENKPNYDPLAFKPGQRANGNNLSGYSGKSSWAQTNRAMMRGDSAHEAARKSAKESPRPNMPPPVADSLKPKTAPASKALTTLQAGFLLHVCQEADRGNADIRPARIQELMGLGDGMTTSIYTPLQEKGFLKATKHSGRHVQLHPIRRPDGRTYEPLKKVNGVTICERGYAQDYCVFDARYDN